LAIASREALTDPYALSVHVFRRGIELHESGAVRRRTCGGRRRALTGTAERFSANTCEFQSVRTAVSFRLAFLLAGLPSSLIDSAALCLVGGLPRGFRCGVRMPRTDFAPRKALAQCPHVRVKIFASPFGTLGFLSFKLRT